MSLKSVNALDYETARALMCSAIGNEALKFYELADSDKLNDVEKKMYRQLIEVDETGQSVYAMSDSVLMGSLKTLSEKHYGQKTVILIDEYDVPLAKANEQGYYDSVENIWSVLFTTGYLTKRGEVAENGLWLVITNREIHNIFMTQIRSWMQKKIREDKDRIWTGWNE